MSENFFFNPGQSISSDFDFNKVYIAAQIYHEKAKKPVLIVQEKDSQPYVVFDEAAAITQEKQEANQNFKEYKVVKKINDDQTSVK